MQSEKKKVKFIAREKIGTYTKQVFAYTQIEGIMDTTLSCFSLQAGNCTHTDPCVSEAEK